MSDFTPLNYRKKRAQSLIAHYAKKFLFMAMFVVIGETMLLQLLKTSLIDKEPSFVSRFTPRKIANIAVRERPILRATQAYESIMERLDFDKVMQTRYPAHIRGTRPDYRTIQLQDKEGAKVGYVVKF